MVLYTADDRDQPKDGLPSQISVSISHILRIRAGENLLGVPLRCEPNVEI